MTLTIYFTVWVELHLLHYVIYNLLIKFNIAKNILSEI